MSRGDASILGGATMRVVLKIKPWASNNLPLPKYKDKAFLLERKQTALKPLLKGGAYAAGSAVSPFRGYH